MENDGCDQYALYDERCVVSTCGAGFPNLKPGGILPGSTIFDELVESELPE